MRFDDATIGLLERQRAVISRRQLLGIGYSGGQIDAMVRQCHLAVMQRGVYRRPGSPGGTAQEAVAAVLRAGTGARATGPLLLGLLGCEGYEGDEASFTILLPPGRRLVSVGFDWRTDPAPDLHGATIAGVPGVVPERMIAELAVNLVDDDAVLLAADRLRWRTGRGHEGLARVAERLPADHPGVPRLRRLGLLTGDRPESPGERLLEASMRDLDPPLEWQVWVTPTTGSTRSGAIAPS